MAAITRFFCAALLVCMMAVAAHAKPHSQGQTVYVPAYSHIYFGNKQRPLPLSVTLSIRNIDSKASLVVTAVEYYKTEGALVRHFIEKPVTLGPLGSIRYIVNENDNTGGSGANFLVEWHAKKPVNPPIIESVMIGTQSQLGISFSSRGEEVH